MDNEKGLEPEQVILGYMEEALEHGDAKTYIACYQAIQMERIAKNLDRIAETLENGTIAILDANV